MNFISNSIQRGILHARRLLQFMRLFDDVEINFSLRLKESLSFFFLRDATEHSLGRFAVLIAFFPVEFHACPESR